MVEYFDENGNLIVAEEMVECKLCGNLLHCDDAWQCDICGSTYCPNCMDFDECKKYEL